MSGKVVLATKVPSSIAEKVEKLVKEGKYLNKADFLRVATRKELAEVS